MLCRPTYQLRPAVHAGPWSCCFLILALVLSQLQREQFTNAAELDFKKAVKICREYLNGDDTRHRERLQKRMESYSGDIDEVLSALTTKSYKPVEPGYHGDEQFSVTALREKYPKDWLYFVVPKNYSPDKPTGLILFLHGGGLDTSRDAAMYTLRFPSKDSSEDTSRSGDMLAATEMITVGPSAPGKGESYYRWCLRASEQYLVDVIDECRERFNIDPNRVFLLGHSMGGFGAFHHAQRQPDRFAAIISSSGAWDCGYWPALRGTPFCFIHGVNDAVRGERWHHTDVEYGRLTRKIFEREELEHAYYEHDGWHGFSQNRENVAEYLAATKTLRRDPYYPQIAIGTPQGFANNYLNPVRHNRWLSLNETVEGKIRVDELVATGDDFDEWKLIHRRPMRRGAAIEAINRGDNRIEVTTQNVASFTLWLHPQMVDVAEPVKVIVDGETRFSERVRSSLAAAIESYERRHDWGLIYPIKIELSLRD